MILIVDDNAPMRAMIKQYVQRFSSDREYYECCDGVEAVDAVQRFHPEWILMDIKMPVMDGLVAMKKIREQYPEAKIIIVTNFNDKDMRETAEKYGVTGYVLKERLFELRVLMQ